LNRLDSEQTNTFATFNSLRADGDQRQIEQIARHAVVAFARAEAIVRVGKVGRVPAVTAKVPAFVKFPK
jgi:hypothetical protein